MHSIVNVVTGAIHGSCAAYTNLATMPLKIEVVLRTLIWRPARDVQVIVGAVTTREITMIIHVVTPAHERR